MRIMEIKFQQRRNFKLVCHKFRFPMLEIRKISTFEFHLINSFK